LEEPPSAGAGQIAGEHGLVEGHGHEQLGQTGVRQDVAEQIAELGRIRLAMQLVHHDGQLARIGVRQKTEVDARELGHAECLAFIEAMLAVDDLVVTSADFPDQERVDKAVTLDRLAGLLAHDLGHAVGVPGVGPEVLGLDQLSRRDRPG
jgi:hypothetical protein